MVGREMNERIRETKPAKGATGYLIRVGDGHVFRVYDKGHIHKFVDYDILHYDLEIKILEDDAVFYRSEFGNYLDYPPIDESK
jgi:hypothetical protein